MIRLFSVIALLVLSVSVSSVFVESAYADEADAIAVILGMTYGNIQESFVDAGINPEDDPVFLAAQEDYFEALTALEAGDLAAAEENALSAMKLFEISAENIGELLEVQEATLQPPGLGTAVASIFNVQEGITNSDNESDELRELIKLNNFDDIDFTEYDESVNLAKTLLADGIVPDAQAQLVLADGIVPDAQAQLVLANQIKDNLYAEIQAAAVENSKESIEEFLDEQENLGLTKKDIRELEEILEDITEEVDAPGNSGDAPGQNNEDAPGQNKDGELPPGFGAAGDNPSENGLANGIGLGLGGDNLPSGQLKKFEAGLFLVYSPDDYFEDPIDDLVEDSFEENYDGLYKDSKVKEKKDKLAEAATKAIGKANAKGNSGGGNPNCSNEGVTDNDPTNTLGTLNVAYVVQDFTAVGSSCAVANPSQINIQVSRPSDGPLNLNQGDSFTPTEDGTYTITASFQGQFESRIVTVGNQAPTIGTITGAFTIDEGTNGHSLSATASDPEGDNLTYAWTFSGEGPITVTMYNEDTLNPTFDVSLFSGTQSRDITFTLTVTDDGVPVQQDTDTVVVTVDQV